MIVSVYEDDTFTIKFFKILFLIIYNLPKTVFDTLLLSTQYNTYLLDSFMGFKKKRALIVLFFLNPINILIALSITVCYYFNVHNIPLILLAIYYLILFLREEEIRTEILEHYHLTDFDIRVKMFLGGFDESTKI